MCTSLTRVFSSCSFSPVMHEDINVFGCSDTDAEFMYGLDGEVMVYADFIKQKAVNAMPPFADQITYTALYEFALGERENCRTNLATMRKVYKDIHLDQGKREMN